MSPLTLSVFLLFAGHAFAQSDVCNDKYKDQGNMQILDSLLKKTRKKK